MAKIYISTILLLLAGFYLAVPTAEAQSYCSPLFYDARSNATPLLNDSVSPGLPHLAVLKKRNDALGFLRYGQGTTSLETPTKTVNNYAKSQIGQLGFDLNYTNDWDWGYNFNAITTQEKGLIDKGTLANNDKTYEKGSDTQAYFNIGGHYHWIILYGLGLGTDACQRQYGSNPVSYKSSYSHYIATPSLGLRLGYFFIGLGASITPENMVITDASGTQNKFKGNLVMPKAGLGFNYGGFRDTQLQFDLSFASSPHEKSDKGLAVGSVNRYDFSMEVQYLSAQVGFYLTDWQFEKFYPSIIRSESEGMLSLGYIPWEGQVFSLQILGHQATQQYMLNANDKTSPKFSDKWFGLALNYGVGFY